MMKKLLVSTLALLMVSACSSNEISGLENYASEPKMADLTVSGEILKRLPAAKRKVVVSVYRFDDLTGQNKPNDKISDYSRAVTQGGSDIISKALMDAGSGSWFTVLERKGLENLLQERKIIRATRNTYAQQNGGRGGNLPPLLYAGMLIEGGIISYESNILTGGLGARYLGIGANSEYRQDLVTVYLRAVNVSNGEIILSVNTSKTIYSTMLSGNVFKYIGINELLEIEGGVAFNEPPQFAVRQAIEMAVYSLVMEGKVRGIWDFANPQKASPLVQQYARMGQQESEKLLNTIEYDEPGEPKRQQDIASSSWNRRDAKRTEIMTVQGSEPEAQDSYLDRMSHTLLHLFNEDQEKAEAAKAKREAEIARRKAKYAAAEKAKREAQAAAAARRAAPIAPVSQRALPAPKFIAPKVVAPRVAVPQTRVVPRATRAAVPATPATRARVSVTRQPIAANRAIAPRAVVAAPAASAVRKPARYVSSAERKAVLKQIRQFDPDAQKN